MTAGVPPYAKYVSGYRNKWLSVKRVVTTTFTVVTVQFKIYTYHASFLVFSALKSNVF